MKIEIFNIFYIPSLKKNFNIFEVFSFVKKIFFIFNISFLGYLKNFPFFNKLLFFFPESGEIEQIGKTQIFFSQLFLSLRKKMKKERLLIEKSLIGIIFFT